MSLQSGIPGVGQPGLACLSAAEVEDQLLEALVSQLRTERELLPKLLRRNHRLRRVLSKSREAVAQLRRDLSHARRSDGRDLLTGLPNRSGFEQPMGRMLAQHTGGRRKLALLFVDLDGFKAVNDRLGHSAGDELLQVVSARLAAGMRRGDLVCRHGGDEFVCLLPNLDSEDRASSLAKDLLHAITQPCALNGQRVSVRASIGVAIYPRDGDTLPLLLHSADSAMYAAKRQRCGVAMARPVAAAG